MKYDRFPIKKPQMLKRWIMATGRSNWQPSTASRVCSLHFKSNDFVDTPNMTQKILKNDTIPTINVSYYIEEVGIDPLNQLQKVIQIRKSYKYKYYIYDKICTYIYRNIHYRERETESYIQIT